MKALTLALVALLLQGCVGYVPVAGSVSVGTRYGYGAVRTYPAYPAYPVYRAPNVIDCYCAPGPNGRLVPLRPY